MFESLMSLWTSISNRNSQSASVVGDNNHVTQHIHVYSPNDRRIAAPIAQPVTQTDLSVSQPGIKAKEVSEEQGDQFDLLHKYREIASNGNSDTALKLLEDLKAEDKYKEGEAAFRLAFNIGIIRQNIGSYEIASAELRRAYTFAPDNPKAIAALALAELIEGRDEAAFERSQKLLSIEGDHVNLCATIAFNAAKRLGKPFRTADYPHIDNSNDDVIIAKLDYIAVVYPTELDAAVNEALEADPTNPRIASVWAHAVLKDAQNNRAFILGSKMPEGFDEDVSKCASILVDELEHSLDQNPPNMILLPSVANNAAVALRLDGKDSEAFQLIDRVLKRYPGLEGDLAQIKAILLLQQDRHSEALDLISPMQEHADFQIMASEIEAQSGALASALTRINRALQLEMHDDLRCHALATKARIGISLQDRSTADEAIEELSADFEGSPVLAVLRSAYSRRFVLQLVGYDADKTTTDDSKKAQERQKILKAFQNVDDWPFLEIYQAAQELFFHGLYRECCNLLRERVSPDNSREGGGGSVTI